MEQSSRFEGQGSALQTVASYGSDTLEISSKFGHGGARINSGGPRENSGGARPGAGRPRKEPEPAPQRAVSARRVGPRWHVVEVQSGQELRLVRELSCGEVRAGFVQRPGFTMFMPLTKAMRRTRAGPVIEVVPMIRRYVFARFDAAIDPWKLLVIPDQTKVWTTRSERPIPLRDAEIVPLMLLSEREMGLDPLAKTPRGPGAALAVKVGPWAKFDAFCIRCDGLTTTATVGLFGRDTEITLPYADFTDA